LQIARRTVAIIALAEKIKHKEAIYKIHANFYLWVIG